MILREAYGVKSSRPLDELRTGKLNTYGLTMDKCNNCVGFWGRIPALFFFVSPMQRNFGFSETSTLHFT